MNHSELCVPPGFRFHPTEEELVGYYLKGKVNSLKFDRDVIIEIDLYRMEPWDIQGIFFLYTLHSNLIYSLRFMIVFSSEYFTLFTIETNQSISLYIGELEI